MLGSATLSWFLITHQRFNLTMHDFAIFPASPHSTPGQTLDPFPSVVFAGDLRACLEDSKEADEI